MASTGALVQNPCKRARPSAAPFAQVIGQGAYQWNCARASTMPGSSLTPRRSLSTLT